VIDRVLDIAGVPVRARATDPARDAALGATLVGFPSSVAAPWVDVAIDAREVDAPTRPPDDELVGVRFWTLPDGMVASTDGLLVEARGNRAVVHLADPERSDLVEGCLAMALTWLLAPHGRFVLHGAAVARGDRGILLLGHTGAGKSTAAAAALDAGWRLLGDDQVVVDASEHRLDVYGFHRAPAVPLELGASWATRGTVLDDPRARVELPRDVLATGKATIEAVVLLAHDGGDGALRPASAHAVLPLLLQSFAATVDASRRVAFFPVAARLTRLPKWELAHARDARVRRTRAATLLERALTSRGAVISPGA
jgi:hypothetical protein